MDNLDYQRDEYHVHLIVYHLIWCPKRRRKVLVHQIGKRCEDLIRRNATRKAGRFWNWLYSPITSISLCVYGLQSVRLMW